MLQRRVRTGFLPSVLLSIDNRSAEEIGAIGEPRKALTERLQAVSVAKVLEITASSPKSFDDAVRAGIARAEKTLDQVQGAWIQDQTVVVEKGKITEYRVRMRVTFVLKD